MNKRAGIFGGFLLLAGSAFGSQVTFATQPGASDSDGSLSASATFITASNLLTIHLFNNISGIVSDGQAINGLQWTFNNSAAATSIASSSGDLVNVASDGSFTDLGTSSLIWQLDSNGLGLCVLCVGGKPSELIIGPRSSDNKYDNLNSSILQHNPNINTEATFMLNVPGLKSSDTVASATFSFGTIEGVDMNGGQIQSTPEPASLMLVGAGLLGLGFLGRRFRQPR